MVCTDLEEFTQFSSVVSAFKGNGDRWALSFIWAKFVSNKRVGQGAVARTEPSLRLVADGPVRSGFFRISCIEAAENPAENSA